MPYRDRKSLRKVALGAGIGLIGLLVGGGMIALGIVLRHELEERCLRRVEQESDRGVLRKIAEGLVTVSLRRSMRLMPFNL